MTTAKELNYVKDKEIIFYPDISIDYLADMINDVYVSNLRNSKPTTAACWFLKYTIKPVYKPTITTIVGLDGIGTLNLYDKDNTSTIQDLWNRKKLDMGSNLLSIDAIQYRNIVLGDLTGDSLSKKIAVDYFLNIFLREIFNGNKGDEELSSFCKQQLELAAQHFYHQSFTINDGCIEWVLTIIRSLWRALSINPFIIKFISIYATYEINYFWGKFHCIRMIPNDLYDAIVDLYQELNL